MFGVQFVKIVADKMDVKLMAITSICKTLVQFLYMWSLYSITISLMVNLLAFISVRIQ